MIRFTMTTLRAIGVAGAVLLPVPAAGAYSYLIAMASRGELCDTGQQCIRGGCAIGGGTCVDNTDCAGCFAYENEDVVMCRPTGTGPLVDGCDWSLFLDGSAAGLNSGIRALDVLPDGSVVLRASADNSVPDIAGVNHKDVVRFLPRDRQGNSSVGRLPYREGAWQLFFDGDAVEANSGGRLIDGMEVLSESCHDVNGDGRVGVTECDILFSPTASGTLGGFDFEIEDLIRCRPTSLSAGGVIEACDYTLFYDASTVGVTPYPPPPDVVAWGMYDSGGTPSFAFIDYDSTNLHGTLFFMAGQETSLPPHQTLRDILRTSTYIGPRGFCSGIQFLACLNDSECPQESSCIFYGNPWATEEAALNFDGSAVMPFESIAAFAVLTDEDGDGIPDALDNCPATANPGLCSGSTNTCTSDNECDGGACLQADADGDGVGDACDRCPGQRDAECVCGNFVIDGPGETCDLGAPGDGGANGLPESNCDANCQTRGRCTRSGETCSVASDCAEAGDGEGCCGNGQLDSNVGSGDEQCDDGNLNDADACGSCRIAVIEEEIPLPPECVGSLNARITPTFVRALRFRKQRQKVEADNLPYHFSQWVSRGEFNLASGIPFDPDTQEVELLFSQDQFVCVGGSNHATPCGHTSECPDGRCTSSLYRGRLRAGDFIQSGQDFDRPRWDYRQWGSQPPNAAGWTEARFTQRLATIHRPLNEAKYKVVGRGEQSDPPVSIAIDPTALGGPPIRLRQTILVGGLCTTQTLVCEPNKRATTLTCYSTFE